MAEKPVLKIGHIRITDHLILGITDAKLKKGEESFQHCILEPVPMIGWNDVGDALCDGEIDGAFILAPYAMELFHSGQKITLVLLGHKTGSILIKNKRANIEKLEDFKGKTILIPYHLSIHHMIINRLLIERGLTTGPGMDVVFEVMAPSQIPEVMQWDEDGDIGGFIVAEPFGSQVIKEGYGELFYLSKDIWPKHPCCIFVVKEEIIGKYPDAVQEICSSLVKSGAMVKEDIKKASQIGADFLKQKVDVVENVLTNPADRVMTNELYPVIEDLETIQNYLTHEISAMSGKIDLEKFIDFQFAKEAKAK